MYPVRLIYNFTIGQSKTLHTNVIRPRNGKFKWTTEVVKFNLITVITWITEVGN